MNIDQAKYRIKAAGDIAFVCKDDPVSRWAVRGQWLLGRRSARYAHALLCVAPEIWVDATPKGVGIYIEADIFRSKPYKYIRVVRPPRSQPTQSNRPNIVDALDYVESESRQISRWIASFFYFYEQLYDFSLGFLPFTIWPRRYCSELVARVYDRCRPGVLDIRGRKRIFSTDLLELTLSAGSEDITDLFMRGLQLTADIPPPTIPVDERIQMFLDLAERKLDIAMTQIVAAETQGRLDGTLANHDCPRLTTVC
jgi:hypothetical protein